MHKMPVMAGCLVDMRECRVTLQSASLVLRRLRRIADAPITINPNVIKNIQTAPSYTVKEGYGYGFPRHQSGCH